MFDIQSNKKCFFFLQYNAIDTSPISIYVMQPFWNWCVEVSRTKYAEFGFLCRWSEGKKSVWDRNSLGNCLLILVLSTMVCAESDDISGFSSSGLQFSHIFLL